MRSSPLQRALKRGPNLILLEVWLDKVLLEIVRAELIRFANALTGYKCLSSYTHVCVCVLYVFACVVCIAGVVCVLCFCVFALCYMLVHCVYVCFCILFVLCVSDVCV